MLIYRYEFHPNKPKLRLTQRNSKFDQIQKKKKKRKHPHKRELTKTNQWLPRGSQIHVRFIAAGGVHVSIAAVTQTLLMPKREVHSPLPLPLSLPLQQLLLLPLPPIHLRRRPGRSKARESPKPHVTGQAVGDPEAPSLDGICIAAPHDETQRGMVLENEMGFAQENQRSGGGGGGGGSE